MKPTGQFRGAWRSVGGAAALAVSLWCAGIAAAQQVPPPESGTPVTKATFANGQVQLRDAVTNTALIVPRGFPLLSGQDPAVQCSISFQSQPAGFDLIYDMTNTAGVDKPLGCLALGIIVLGQQISTMDIRESIDWQAIDANNYAGWGLEYPTYVYSPAFILANSSYAMGITVQYPILDWKHYVKLNLTNPGGEFLNGEGGRGWAARFSLATNGPESWQTVQYGAVLRPGEQRRYVVSVRVTTNPAEWVRTLVPYRNYFRSVYGGVRYQRDNTPIWAVNASDSHNCSDTNPLGYEGPWRPDKNGWSLFAKQIRDQTPGWGGAMVWKPGGSYRYHPENNFPCWPASMWTSTPALSTVFDPANGMPTVAKAGKTLGFWWGRSCQTASTWDPATLENFDPDNPDHLKRAINELDLMAKAGATVIGLDTFDPVNMPFWKQYRWMETMRLRYPNIKFATEPTNCDIMHTMAANYITGWDVHFYTPASQEDEYLLKHANYLADFLVPGHEFWAGFAYDPLTQFFGVVPDANRVVADMQRYASYGYRPCWTVEPSWFGLTIPNGSVVAAKSWQVTVPSDLQISDAQVPLGIALSTGSMPNRVGGANKVVSDSHPSRPYVVGVPAGGGSVAAGGQIGDDADGGDGAPSDAGAPGRKVVVRRSGKAPQKRAEPVQQASADDSRSDVQTFTNPGGVDPAQVVPK